MICAGCGRSIPDGAKFCPACGREISEPLFNEQADSFERTVSLAGDEGFFQARDVQEDLGEQKKRYTQSESYENVNNGVLEMNASTGKSKGKKRLKAGAIAGICAGGVVLLVLTVVAVMGFVCKAKYDRAELAFAEEDYETALEGFSSISFFLDSAEYQAECTRRISYNSASSQMNSGQWDAAAELLAPLAEEGYKDSAVLYDYCNNKSAYGRAAALAEEGDYAGAAEIFSTLGNFEDSESRLTECRNEIDYQKASDLLDLEDFSGAEKLFIGIAGYKDSDEKLEVCRCEPIYRTAQELFKDGLNYDAYVLLSGIETYSDASACMTSCYTELPNTGELYRNEYFSDNSVPLNINNADDGAAAYIKLYTESGELVSCVFVRNGKSCKIKVPVGRYMTYIAYGYDNKWFGEKDAFGDVATYGIQLVDDAGSTVYSFDDGYIITLTLGSGTGRSSNLKLINRMEF